MIWGRRICDLRIAAAAALAATALLLALGAGGCGGCKDDQAALAELVQASGPVERAAAKPADPKAAKGDDWREAKLGAQFYLGDAARTGVGPATLQLGGRSRMGMEPHTILRFGRRGDGGDDKLLVELGSIEIAGGAYQFDLGEISVEPNGGVRISASGGGSRVELLVGRASIRTAGGDLTPLEPGVAVDFSDIQIRTRADAPLAAAPRDAGPDAGSDAGPAAAAVAIEVNGAAEVRRGGEGPWAPLPRSTQTLEAGTQVRVTRGKATLDNGALRVELEKSGSAAVGPELGLAVEGGGAVVRAAPEKAGQIALPGGAISLPAQRRGASVEVTVGGRESKVRGTGGAATLVGKGAQLEMSRGESAMLARTGAIRVLVAVPRTHDVSISAGDNATVHDGRGAAAVRFDFGEACSDGGVIELSENSSFRTPALSAGTGSANLMIGSGGHYYRLRCDEGGRDGRAVKSGRISVVRDSGRRPLPAAAPPFQLDADGRTYRVGYQGVIPTMNVVWKGASGSSFTLRLARAGKDQSFSSTTPSYAIPGSKLSEGTYTVWFEKGRSGGGAETSGGRSKVSTLIIDFDNTAPAIYIDEPDDGQGWGGEVTVQGAVLPGWTPSIDGVPLPLDRQRRFRATVPAPSGALAIRVSHPQRGVHYYLRRQR
jgi:hypothetical protein